MSRCISLRLAIAFLIVPDGLPLAARAQSQDSQTESVADAARRSREQKKAAASKPAPVITDDTLKPAAPASPGANSPAADNASAQAAESAPGVNGENTDQKSKDSAELANLKQQLAEAQKGLDLLQRELALEQDNLYSKSNYGSDTAGKAKLDDLKQQIADKQQSVDTLKTRVAALQDSTGNAAHAAPATPSTPPSAAPQS
jgi:uncharacterized coiled-coil protein SlyX